MDTSHCSLCRCDVEMESVENRAAYKWTCPRCGEIEMQQALILPENWEEYAQHKPTLSGLARERKEYGRAPLVIRDWEDIKTLLDSPEIPRTMLEKLDKVVSYLGNVSKAFGEVVSLDLDNDWPIGYCRDSNELKNVCSGLAEMDWVKSAGSRVVQLERLGWQRYYELGERRVDSNLCFVAMSFTPELKSAYKEGMKVAIEEAADGRFKAVRVDLEQFNDKIDDRIIADIRKCRFLVADFTGHRGGVYFEAGFAMGLGRPVIFTCREDAVDDAHFDTRQYNHITWNDPAELREKLKNRIEATIT